MTNEIQQVREAIERELASARLCPEERSVELSPCGRYELEINAYATANVPAYSTIAVANIREVATGEIVASIHRNDDRCFYAWVTRDGNDYLLFPEDLEGQTVIGLTARKVEGFSSRDDPYIWAEFHPSSDKTRLAILGCYWACPYSIKVYDFREPLNLPLPAVAECLLPGNDATFQEWISTDAFTLRDGQGGDWVFDLSQIELGSGAMPARPAGYSTA